MAQPMRKHSPLMPLSPRLGACIVRNDLEIQLIRRAWKDEAFKRRLIEDPQAAIKEELGTEVLAGVEVQVLEEDPKKAYLILPMSPAAIQEEVPDEMLDKVAVSVWT